MKAIEVVEGKAILNETEKPSIGLNEILIKIKSTAVNRADLMQKKGLYPPPPGASEVLGLECSGVVESVGKEVKSKKPGDEVMALLGGGGYAEYVSCHEFHAINKPKNLNWIEAASIPEVYATCWLNLFLEASMQQGDKVVFHAGASGIGTAGIQLANVFDCESFVTAGTEEKIKFCLNLGASDGEIRSNDIFSKIKEWAPGGVNIILDPVGGEYFERNLDVLSVEGKLIIIGLMGGAKANLNLGLLMVKRQKIIGSTIRARSNETKNIVMQELSEKVIPLFESGMLKPVIHETFYFSECNQAQEMMEANENIGKIILALD